MSEVQNGSHWLVIQIIIQQTKFLSESISWLTLRTPSIVSAINDQFCLFHHDLSVFLTPPTHLSHISTLWLHPEQFFHL